MKLPPTFKTHEPVSEQFLLDKKVPVFTDTRRETDGLRSRSLCETYYDYWERTNTGPTKRLSARYSWQFIAYENQPRRTPANGRASNHPRAFTLIQYAAGAKFRFKQIRRGEDNLVSVYSVHIPDSDQAVGTFTITRKQRGEN